MRIFCFSFFTGVLLLLGGCKNDLDLLDDYHSALVVYGVLDPADTVHYVRVTKIFIGEGDARVFAQTQDSIGFPPGTMSVKIEQWKNGTLLNTYTLSEDTIIPRDSGVFVYPYQVLFRARFPVLKDGSTYKVIATDLVKGMTVNAETPIVQDVTVVEPYSTFDPWNLWDSTSMRFKWKSGEFGKRYNLTIRFHYTEQFLYDTTEVSEHFVDWRLGELDAQFANGNEVMTLFQRRINFLTMLSQQLPRNVFVRRIAGKLDLVYLGAAENFATYLDVQATSNNAVVAFEPFSNVNGGYGLFTSRTTNISRGYWLDSDTRYALRVSPITYGLNFVR
jgi:hypothetical protein